MRTAEEIADAIPLVKIGEDEFSVYRAKTDPEIIDAIRTAQSEALIMAGAACAIVSMTIPKGMTPTAAINKCMERIGEIIPKDVSAEGERKPWP